MGDMQAIDRNAVARAEAAVGILLDWAAWQKGYSMHLGFAPKSAGMQSGYVSQSFDDMCDSAEVQRCIIVDACVDDLKPAGYKAAILKRYLGHMVQLRDYEVSLLLAHEVLMGEFVRKGILF